MLMMMVTGLSMAILMISLYNGLVRKRNLVRSAFSSIDVNLRKRHDLIPSLVDTVKGFARHEQDTLTALMEARSRIRDTSLDESERLRLEREIGPRMGRLIALAEDYPELRSDAHFLNLQRNLTEVEEQISAARRAYNAAVLAMNNAVETFPGNLIASRFGFRRHDFFEVDQPAREPSRMSV